MESSPAQQRPKVLITGINGFIAAHVAAAFLRAGYSVRGSSWSQNPVPSQLLDVLRQEAAGSNDSDPSSVELVEMEDITRPGSFDEAVKGAATICHLASPISLQFTDPEPVMHAAIQGTLSLLRSALEHAGPQLKSFVYAGSSAAMGLRPPDDKTSTFTEEDWNDAAVETAQKLGKDTPGRLIYAASKTAAERALWNFHRETQGQRHFSMAAVNPATVFGPPLYMPPQVDLLSPSIRILYDTVVEGKGVSTVRGGGTVMSSVDVRDVARSMLWAAEHPEDADGQRYLACAWDATPELITEVLAENFPQLPFPVAGQRGQASLSGGGRPVYSGDKAIKATGQDWMDLEKSIVDCATYFLSLQ